MKVFKKILCPTDFTRSSKAALKMAASLSQDHGSELIVVYVESSISDMAISGALPAHQVTDEYLETQSNLDDLIEKSLPSKISVRAIVLAGDVAPQLLQLADKEDVDLIIMSPQKLQHRQQADPKGPSALEPSTLLSSIAQDILDGAPCPVLIVQGDALPRSIMGRDRMDDSTFCISQERSQSNESQTRNGAVGIAIN